MSFILSFLGKGGTGRTTIAIAAAKKLASSGSRVLFLTQESNPVLSLLWGVAPTSEAQEISPHLTLVQLSSTLLLEKGWEEAKELEAKYLRSPTLKNVYGQELGILPGMDQVLALNAIREYDRSGKYDAIVYDGSGDLTTLRMFGTPDILSWYIRRFRQVFAESDIGKALSPFIQPVTSAILNVTWSSTDEFAQEPTNEANELLEAGKKALADPNRVATYLVSTIHPVAIATAKHLWGSAQQVGLTVGGVLLNQQDTVTETISSEFNPLSVTAIPELIGDDWQPLLNALPNFREAAHAPQPLIIDTVKRQVKVFLPGFDKKQVKLTQYGPEITIEAGDQRRNIFLPSPLTGQSVKGAKFQEQYLIISL